MPQDQPGAAVPAVSEAGDEVNDLRESYEEVFADLVTYEQAREVLGGISRYTISRLAREQKVNAVQVLGQYYITRSSIRAYIEELRRASIRPAIKPARPRQRTA